ncbi:protein FAM209A [Erinaceus europaeus]|uniref:Protein FAM209A n=1 Tax=Erinaceus europaeus TaxID=9365 RepID=A0A1S3ADG3_ERIEU|nr:protein FAM209A [Erinaceus europaeus]
MHRMKWFLFLPLFLSCSYAFMFSSLKAKDTQGKVACGGHFRTRQSLPEHTQGWLGSKWLWLFFVITLYGILRFRSDNEKNKELSTNLRGCSLRSPAKKNQNASPKKDYAFNTLTQLEMDLVKFMSKVRNLKVVMSAGSNVKHSSVDGSSDPDNNSITIYEIWGEDEE